MRSKFDEQLKKLNEEMMHMGSRMPIAPKPSWRAIQR